MQDFAKQLYKSKAWQHCRASYLKQVGGLCERCLSEGLITPAAIVHHKIYLNPDNVNDPAVALNFSNLEALCRRHHAEEHTGKRFMVDDSGKVLF